VIEEPASRDGSENFLTETMYGHQKRFRWIVSNLRPSDRIVEFGCGTGAMLTLPLLRRGFDVVGVDLDRVSISFGQQLLVAEGFAADALRACSLVELDFLPDVILASEVLEHIPDAELPHVLDLLRGSLRDGGRLLVTVPNGYGWCEAESYLYFQMGLGDLVKRAADWRLFRSVSPSTWRRPEDDLPASTLADSPHVQRFTRRSLQAQLASHGFKCEEARGSVLIGGPLTNRLFGRFQTVLQLNNRLGERFPTVAAGFFLVCRKAPLAREQRPTG